MEIPVNSIAILGGNSSMVNEAADSRHAHSMYHVVCLYQLVCSGVINATESWCRSSQQTLVLWSGRLGLVGIGPDRNIHIC